MNIEVDYLYVDMEEKKILLRVCNFLRKDFGRSYLKIEYFDYKIKSRLIR